jgi:glucan biosynthesis protein
MSHFPQYNVNNEHQLIRRQNTYVLDRKLITFHSQDRDVSQWPYANYFEVTLPETLNNVQSMRLVEIQLPGNQYVFSNNQQNIKMQFYIIPNVSTQTSKYLALEAQTTVPYEITIQEGYFTPSEMATEIQNLMNQAVTNF